MRRRVYYSRRIFIIFKIFTDLIGEKQYLWISASDSTDKRIWRDLHPNKILHEMYSITLLGLKGKELQGAEQAAGGMGWNQSSELRAARWGHSLQRVTFGEINS